MTTDCITNTKKTTRSHIDLEQQISDLLAMARIAHHYAHDVVCEENEESLELCLFSATHVLDLAVKLSETFQSEMAERAAGDVVTA